MVQGVFAGATAAVGQLAVLLVLWYGALQVQRGHLTSGLLAGFMMYALQVRNCVLRGEIMPQLLLTTNFHFFFT